MATISAKLQARPQNIFMPSRHSTITKYTLRRLDPANVRRYFPSTLPQYVPSTLPRYLPSFRPHLERDKFQPGFDTDENDKQVKFKLGSDTNERIKLPTDTISSQSSETSTYEESVCTWGNLGTTLKKPRIIVEPFFGPPVWWYPIYRVVWAAYHLTMFIYDLATYKYGWMWLTFPTNWSYTLLLVTCVLQAGATCAHYATAKNLRRDEVIYKKMPVLFRIIWMTNSAAITMAPIVTIMYWAVIHNARPITLPSVNSHVVNSFYVITDLIVTGIPVMLLHVIYPVVLAALYVIFSLIYAYLGGTDEQGRPFIPEAIQQLGYGESFWQTAGFDALLCLGVVPFSFLVLFGLYNLKLFVRRACNKNRLKKITVHSGWEHQEIRRSVYWNLLLSY